MHITNIYTDMELNKRVLLRNSYSFDKAMKRLKNLNDDNDIELKKLKYHVQLVLMVCMSAIVMIQKIIMK